MQVRPSTLNFLSFFLNTKLTSFTEMFVNDNIKVVNITREDGDRMEVGDIK